MKQIWMKVVVAIATTRFIPVEMILAVGGMVLGLWLLLPGAFGSETLLPPVAIQLSTVWLIAIGGSHIYGLSRDEADERRVGVRRWSSFFEFVNFSYISALLWFSFGAATFGWFGFMLLALIAATAYLSLSMEKYGDYGMSRDKPVGR